LSKRNKRIHLPSIGGAAAANGGTKELPIGVRPKGRTQTGLGKKNEDWAKVKNSDILSESEWQWNPGSGVGGKSRKKGESGG